MIGGCMTANFRRLVWLFLLIAGSNFASAASLVYAVTYPWTSTTRPSGLGHSVPPEQKVESVRNAWKTDIYSVSVETGQRRLLFSDAGPSFEILAANIMALHADKAYVKGVERYWSTGPAVGVFSHPEAIYELTLDGSNRFRKLFEIDAKNPASELFLNPDGSKLASIGDSDGYMVSIHAASSGALVHSWNAMPLFQKHCPDCLPVSHGWLADGQRLFFTLEIGDLDGDSPAPNDAVGTYLLTEDGKDAGSIPAPEGTANVAGFRRDPEGAPWLLGQSPQGDYIFWDFGFEQASHSPPPAEAQSFAVLAEHDGHTIRVAPIRASGPPMRLSASGRFLAYFERRTLKNYRSEYHLWIKDLQDGTEKELSPPEGVSQNPSLGLNVLGWDERN